MNGTAIFIPTVRDLSAMAVLHGCADTLRVLRRRVPVIIVDASATPHTNHVAVESLRRQGVPVRHVTTSTLRAAFDRCSSRLLSAFFTDFSYGAARNRCFAIASALDVENVIFFDDDTTPNAAAFADLERLLGHANVGVSTGPYIGDRGIDYSFLCGEDVELFLQAIGPHGEASLARVRDIGSYVQGSAITIRGGNCGFGPIYRELLAPAIRYTPGLDDSFVASQARQRGMSIAVSTSAVRHNRYFKRTTPRDVRRYVIGWAICRTFEVLVNTQSSAAADLAIHAYASFLGRMAHSTCRHAGRALLRADARASLRRYVQRALAHHLDVHAHWNEVRSDLTSGLRNVLRGCGPSSA